MKLAAWLAGLMILLTGLSSAEAEAKANRQDVKTADFTGRLYLPEGTPKKVAVVVIGGSEGHLYQADEIGPQLAAAGYAALGVEYHSGFDAGRKLDLIPIETFTSAVRWLKKSPVAPAVVVVMGDSRGSEAALLTGMYSRDVGAVAAFVPSSLLWGATDNSATVHNAAWSWQGKALACANCAADAGSFQDVLGRTGEEAPARIAAERINGAVFLAGSDADAVWPSARMARELAARLARARFPFAVTLLTFPDASHQLWGTGPRNPVQTYTYPGGSYTSNAGGTAAGTEKARNETWAAMLVFLHSLEARS